MLEDTSISPLVEDNLALFCQQLLGTRSDPALHDELLDHLRSAFREKRAAGLDELAALRIVRARFGDPSRITALLDTPHSGNALRRGTRFLLAWLTSCVLTQIFILAAWAALQNTVVTPPGSSGTFAITLPARLGPFTGLAQLFIAVGLTAVLLSAWRSEPPRRLHAWLILPMYVVVNLCVESPISLYFENVGRLFFRFESSDLAADPYGIVAGGSVVAMIALGLLACRYLGTVHTTRAGLICSGLCACVAMLSPIHLISVLIRQMAHSGLSAIFGCGSILIFCVVAGNLAWTISYCIELAIHLPKRFQLAR